jgi:hypothetical protein
MDMSAKAALAALLILSAAAAQAADPGAAAPGKPISTEEKGRIIQLPVGVQPPPGAVLISPQPAPPAEAERARKEAEKTRQLFEANQRMLKSLAGMGSLAGAMSACDAHEADLILACARAAFDEWMGGAEMTEGQADEFRKAADTAFRDAVNEGHKSKFSSGISCAEVARTESESDIWKVCKKPSGRSAPAFTIQ